MNDFSKEVWFNTYRYNKTKENDINDTFRRVANAIGSNEEERQSFYNILNQYIFCPGGRILSNAGTEFEGTTLFNCVHGESLVYTKELGMIKMKDVRCGHHVLTHKNRFKKVLNHWSTGIKKTYTVVRTFSNQKQQIKDEQEMSRFLAVTGNHEIYTDNDEWVKVEDYINKPNKKLKQPKFEYNGDVPSIFPIENGKHVFVDNDFAWIMGMYLAEGAIHKYNSNHPNIYFTLNSNEYDSHAKRIVHFSENILGYGCYIQTWDDYNFIQVNISSPNLAILVKSIFGHGFKNKRLPDWVFGLSDDIKKALLDGFLSGDGTNYESLEDDYNFFVIANPTLAYQLGLLARSINKNVRFNLKTKGKLIKNRSIATTISNSEDKCYINNSPVEVEVFDMEVEEDHSFVAGDVICHNCYVGPKPKHDQDSIEGIVEILLKQMKTLKSEGGWGMNFSFLRPRNTLIKKIGVETPGSVKFMELYNKASEIITAGSGNEKTGDINKKNRIRKGAMMGILDCWHPDIEEFIEAKRNYNKLDKFNISVGCYNDFMDLVSQVESTGIDQEWNLVFPDTSHEKYEKLWDGDIYTWKKNGFPIITYKTISIKYLWNKIMKSTYDFNDPGVIFLDRANQTHLNNYENPYAIRASNPCGEQMLIYGGVCDLGSLCLPFLLNKDYTDFDEEKVIFATRNAVQFLDKINDISKTPCEEYNKNAKQKRRIGLGVMGWGSALYLLKIRFGSNEAEKVKDKLMSLITRTAVQESIDLARLYGCYVGCDKEKLANHIFWKQIRLPQTLIDNIRIFGLRNSALFSIQPTGNTSILYEIVSGGCEPVFLHNYIRTTIVQSAPDDIKDMCPKYWQGEFVETEMFKFVKEGNETILKGVDENGIIYKIDKNRGLTKEVLCEDYAVKILKENNEWNPKAEWAVTTNELTVSDHITDLKGWAKWIDSSISKTINLTNNYPYEDFKKIYIDAYNSEIIKGITTYREGTMTSVLSSISQKTKKRPKKLMCDIHHPSVKGAKYYAAVGLKEDGSPYEIFVGNNGIDSKSTNGFIQRIKDGKYSLISDNEIIVDDMCEQCSDEEEAVARLASISLRNGVEIQAIVDQLEKTKGNLSGFAKVICRILRKYIPDKTHCEEQCPECNKKLIYQEGCKKCVECGYSKC